MTACDFDLTHPSISSCSSIPYRYLWFTLVDFTAHLNTSMDISETERGRVRYADDVETGPRRQPRRRGSSVSSTRSGVSGRQTIDPDVILPIGFRTLYDTVYQSISVEDLTRVDHTM